MSLVTDSAVHHEPIVAKLDRVRRTSQIRRAAVLGAGTMGSRIAAHLANAGLPVLLLDIVSEKGERSSVAAIALSQLLKISKPPAFAAPSVASRISIGNFEDDLHRLSDCDWIIEAVAENLEIKRSVLGKIADYLHPEAILTTNTSGLPVAQVGAQLPAYLRRRWFGTHFFNPPRYMRLVEVITTPETEPAAVATIAELLDRKLGKIVVAANDVPNFIANRIGTFMMLNTFDIMDKQELSVEEIDFLTGPVLGWPKTGTFRLADLVGIDVAGWTAQNFLRTITDERSDLKMPPVIEQLIARKWLGDKTKQGFYKKERGSDGNEIRTVLDFNTFEYRAPSKPSFPSVELAGRERSFPTRVQAILQADPSKDRAASFYWRLLSELWIYAANRIGEVATSFVEIDRAMTAGYNWERGPFAIWDAAGVPGTVARMRAEGMAIPDVVEKLLASGATSWYSADGDRYFDHVIGAYGLAAKNPDLLPVASYKRMQANGVFAENESISLVDTGDGIGCFELHSKMNSLDPDVVSFIHDSLQAGSDASKNFDGFIIATDAANFSVGASLTHLLWAIQDKNWESIDLAIRNFQGMTQAIKFSARPVVSAPFGMCLGGGAEILLHSALRQPHLELYAGLVETGVGLIPGGGGCKEMLLRALASADSVRHDARGDSSEIFEAVKSVFEIIAMAKVSTSTVDARSFRIIEDVDSISMNRDRLIGDARIQALRLARSGYTAPIPRNDIPAPGETIRANLKLGAYLMREGEFISDHDVAIAGHLAHILAGGDVTAGTPLSEQLLLDLEREAFLSLCGEPKTAERIVYTLKTGKPLRN
jgi:3-hydroxyacyl-CoA dehydrogenase